MTGSRSAAFTVIGLAGVLACTGCDTKQRGPAQTPASPDPLPSQTSIAEPPETLRAATPTELEQFTRSIPGDGQLFAYIDTSLGRISCELFERRAPETVGNFVGLATGQKAWRTPDDDRVVQGWPFYRGVVFHRVIPNFLIQAGDRSGTGSRGPGYSIPDEFHPELRHDRAGILSMANRGEPNSSGSQWFILERPAPHLDDRHSVFGLCGDLDVVKAIARSPAGTDNRPENPPMIKDVTLIRRPTTEVLTP